MTTVMPTEDTRKDKLCREIFCFPGYELTTTELSPDGCPYCKIIAGNYYINMFNKYLNFNTSSSNCKKK